MTIIYGDPGLNMEWLNIILMDKEELTTDPKIRIWLDTHDPDLVTFILCTQNMVQLV